VVVPAALAVAVVSLGVAVAVLPGDAVVSAAVAEVVPAVVVVSPGVAEAVEVAVASLGAVVASQEVAAAAVGSVAVGDGKGRNCAIPFLLFCVFGGYMVWSRRSGCQLC
jgi:hypothetical protein